MTDKSRGKDLDWSAIADDDAGPAPQPIVETTIRTTAPTAPRVSRRSLMDLCTPLFGLAAVLPREAGAPQPAYQPFREQVLGALAELERAAAENGIEREDARAASYAVCLLLDEQVAESEWSARMLWASEPLHVVLHEDPLGGINFFTRLEAFGDRQAAVKEIYLVCLALGFRGKFAELETTQQAAQLAAVRQNVLRSVQPTPIDKVPHLFPDAYREAAPAGRGKPAVPGWWLPVGIGLFVLGLIVWCLLFWFAGGMARPASEAVRPVASVAAPAQGVA